VLTDGYGAIVYDLDGTLVELDVDWAAARRDVAGVLETRDLAVEESMGLWELLTLAEDAGFGQAVEVKLGDHEREGAWNARRLPLAGGLPHDVPVGVCSLNCEAACHQALELHGIDRHVAVLTGRDSHERRKPDPAPLLATIEALEAEPDETLFVGDSDRDEIAAERAGVDFRWASDAETAAD